MKNKSRFLVEPYSVVRDGACVYYVGQALDGTWLVTFDVWGTKVDTGFRGGSREQAEAKAVAYATY